MKIDILQENLVKQLNLISSVLPSKSNNLPILNNFLLEAEKEKIRITVSNLETTMVTQVAGKIAKEGKTTLPAKAVLAILPSLVGEKLVLETEGALLKIKGRKTTVSLNTEPAEDFPKIEEEKRENQGSFPKELIEEIEKRVSFAASKDETRAILTGILFKTEEGRVSIVATDGFRLSLLRRDIEKKLSLDNLVLPAAVIRNLFQIIKEEETKEVRTFFSKEKTQLSFLLAQTKIFTRLLEGEYPDYEKIIPKEYSTKTILNREEFLKAVKLGAVFARESANIVRLKTNKNILFVSANSPQIGENKTEMEAEIEGEKIEIAFNFRFLLDFLNSSESEEVIIETSGPLSPGVFKFKGEKDFLYIIMPVRLQES